jgi:hypothetical protein
MYFGYELETFSRTANIKVVNDKDVLLMLSTKQIFLKKKHG